jgi:phosphatidylinositol 3,5-bisphosphate 5-phosphatase
LLFVKHSEPVGIIAGRHIYQVKETALVPIVSLTKKNKISSEEQKYKEMFQSISSDKDDLYFSYSYDLTNTMQYNYLKRNENNSFSTAEIHANDTETSDYFYNEKFLWNYYIGNVFLKSINKPFWLVPLIQGFFEQKGDSSFYIDSSNL